MKSEETGRDTHLESKASFTINCDVQIDIFNFAKSLTKRSSYKATIKREPFQPRAKQLEQTA